MKFLRVFILLLRDVFPDFHESGQTILVGLIFLASVFFEKCALFINGPQVHRADVNVFF